MKIKNKELVVLAPKGKDDELQGKPRSIERNTEVSRRLAEGKPSLCVTMGSSKNLMDNFIALSKKGKGSLDKISPMMKKGSSVEKLIKRIQILPRKTTGATGTGGAGEGERNSSKSPDNCRKAKPQTSNYASLIESSWSERKTSKFLDFSSKARDRENSKGPGVARASEKSLIIRAQGKDKPKVYEVYMAKRGGNERSPAPTAIESRKQAGSLDRLLSGSGSPISKRPEVPVRNPESSKGLKIAKRSDLAIASSGFETTGSRKAFNSKTPSTVEVPASVLNILKQINEQKMAQSLEKKPKTLLSRAEKRKAEFKSEEKDPKKYVLSLGKDLAPTNYSKTSLEQIEGEKNEYFQFLHSSLVTKPEVKSLASEIQRSFRGWSEREKVDFFPFKTLANFYTQAECIGKGCFGKVYKAVQVATGITVALKAIPKNSIKSKDSRKKIDKEVYILKVLNQVGSVIKLYEVFEDDEYVYLVFELLKNGDLVKYFQVNPLLEEEDLKIFFRKIVVGIQSMHIHGILHRDIKLDNILLDQFLNPKICDFGISTVIEPGKKILDTGGTPAYLAPEVILAEGDVGPKSDVWALGILLYLLVFGFVPFKANDMQLLYQKILYGKFKFPEGRTGSPQLRDLISSMLKVDIDTRLSIEQVLEHEWFASGLQGYEQSQALYERSSAPDEQIRRAISLYLETLGFPLSYIQQSLKKNSFNHIKACFDTLAIKLSAIVVSDQ